MKFSPLLLSLFLIMSCLCCRQEAGAEFPPELVKRVQAATVMVYVCNPADNVVRQGSGFLFRSEGHLLTNYHVLGEAAVARVRTPDGRDFSVKAIVAASQSDDLVEAVVDIPTGTVPHLMPAATLPKRGDPVMIIGSPLGVSKAVSQGNVTFIGDVPQYGKAIVHSAHSFPGSSGSPLVNGAGDVVGIESAGLVGRTDINLAIPLERFSGLMAQYRQLRSVQTQTAAAQPESGESVAFQDDVRMAESGDPAAQVRVGMRYEQGRGTSANCFEALNWYRKAASHGHAAGAFHLGRMYYDGRCSGQNLSEAAGWLQKAAERGCADAQRMFGTMCFNGEGVPRDKVRACTWMKLAAMQRNAEADRLLKLITAEMSPQEIKSAEEKAGAWKPSR